MPLSLKILALWKSVVVVRGEIWPIKNIFWIYQFLGVSTLSRVAASRLIVIFLKGYLYSIPPMVTSHTVQSQLTFSSSSPPDDQTMIIATTVCYNKTILNPLLVTSLSHTH